MQKTSPAGAGALMPDPEVIGRRIKEVRQRRGLSQAQLAHPELSDSYISLIEGGSRTPTPTALEIIARKLKCSVDYLVRGIESEEIERIRSILDSARQALEAGNKSEARHLYNKALSEPNITRLPELRNSAEYGLALTVEASGDLENAIRILLELRDKHLDSLSDELRIGSALALSRCYRDLGQFDLAIQVAEKEIAAKVGKGWTDHLIELASTLLSSYYGRGDLLRAEQYAAQLLATAETLGTPRAIIAANWNAAQLARMTGKGEEALARMERAWAERSNYGDVRNRARLLVAYAGLRIDVRPGEAAECRELLLQAERELRESPAGSLDLVDCFHLLAIAEIELGHADEALRYALKALEENGGTSTELTASIQVRIGQAHLMLNQREEATAAVRSAADVLVNEPRTKSTAETWLEAAALLQELGDYEGSRTAFQHAMECSGV